MFKRILMNQADASPGNGAVPPTAAVPTDALPQAQGGSPITMTKEALDAALASAAEMAAKKVSDSFYAERRRASEGKGERPNGKPDTKNENASSGDDPSSLLALRDSFDDATSEMKLTKGQKQLLREAVMSKRPSDVDGFVSDFATRAGWGSQSASPVAPVSQPAAIAANATPQRNAAPVSDRGSPPVSAVPLEDQSVLSMSPSDRDALRKQKGEKWFTDKVIADSKTQTFKLR